MAKSSHAPWQRVVSSQYLQLSAVDPPSAQHPGVVIGPGSRVRVCNPESTVLEYGVLCLEVEIDGAIERGYTIRRMVALRPETASTRRRTAFATVAVLAILVLTAVVIFQP